jgi:hypothetical protein
LRREPFAALEGLVKSRLEDDAAVARCDEHEAPHPVVLGGFDQSGLLDATRKSDTENQGRERGDRVGVGKSPALHCWNRSQYSRYMARYSLNGRDLVAKTVEGETVLINLATGAYYSIDGAGAIAFTHLVAGREPAAVGDDIAGLYGIEPATARLDLERFVAELVEEGILLPGETDHRPNLEVPVPSGDYAAPALEVYTDMGDLLALDPPMPGLKDIPWEPPSS